MIVDRLTKALNKSKFKAFRAALSVKVPEL